MNRVYLLLLAVIMLTSCSKDDVDSNILESKSISGITDHFPYEIEYNGIKIIIDTLNIDTQANLVETKSGWSNIMYITPEMKQLVNNQKISIVKNCGSYQGIYIGDTFEFAEKLLLPSTASVAKVLLFTPLPFYDLRTFDYGIDWKCVTKSGGTYLEMVYYTVRINYDLAGRYLGSQVFPFDGRTVKVPYQIFYD